MKKYTKEIALVCRNGEYSFPKGHLEEGETIEECAIRETKEEVGHNCHIIGDKEIAVLHYNTPRGEVVENYYYLAIDDGVCKEEIEETISYLNIKEMWNKIKNQVERIVNDEKM